jgi:response regulator RpfG family c-di-GMP phosphodiesterase
MSEAQASSLMADGRGAHFDPDVLDTFMLAVPVPA